MSSLSSLLSGKSSHIIGPRGYGWATYTPIPTPNRQIKALASNNRSKGRKGSQPPHQFAQEEIAILLQHKQVPMSFAWHIAHLSP